MSKTPSTTFVKLLRIGDVIFDEGDFWEVTRNPQIEPTGRIMLYLRPYPYYDGIRSRAYDFDPSYRVRLHNAYARLHAS